MTERHKKPLGLMYLYVNTQQIIHFKYVQYIVCQFYLNKAIKIINTLTH